MKFKSQLVTQASGSVGGTTFAHNQGGLYMRARSIPTNPSSAQQTAVRANLTSLSAAWVNSLTAAQRAGWTTYNQNVPFVGPLGDSRKIGPIANYNRSNTVRLQAGLPRVDNAPTNYTTGSFTPPTITATGSTSTITVSFTGSDSWVSVANSGMIVYASRPQNASINFFKGPYRYAGVIRGTATGVASPSVITAPFAFSAGQRLFYKVVVSTADGRLSQSQEGFCTGV